MSKSGPISITPFYLFFFHGLWMHQAFLHDMVTDAVSLLVITCVPKTRAREGLKMQRRLSCFICHHRHNSIRIRRLSETGDPDQILLPAGAVLPTFDRSNKRGDEMWKTRIVQRHLDTPELRQFQTCEIFKKKLLKT
jgi:hypothetical protein